jgi:predicted Fe-Mo cluster-binding NifX family protein
MKCGDLMKICVSAASGILEAQVDPRFGRCPYFVIVDSETPQFEVIPNPASGAMGGAGIQAAQTIASRGTNVLITGSIGPNAFQALSAAGVRIMIGASGTVMEAIEKYRKGELKEASSPTVPGHFGMGMGRGRRWGQRQ